MKSLTVKPFNLLFQSPDKEIALQKMQKGGRTGGRSGMAAGTTLVRDKVSGRNTHTESLGTTAETFKSSNLK